ETLNAPRLLQAGERVEVGPVSLLFGLGEPPADTVFEKLRAETARDVAPALFAGTETRRIPLGEQLAIGRDPASPLSLHDPAVSRRHGLIHRESIGYRVVDLQSTSGTFANGRRFDEHMLTFGDRL